MATKNPFDLLDDDTEDPSLLIAAAEQQKLEKPKKAPGSAPAQAQPVKAAKLPTKPLPPAQAVREAKDQPGRGGGHGVGRGRGRGGSGFNRDFNASDNSNGFSRGYRPSEEGEGRKQTERRAYGGPRGSFRGGHRVGFNDGESGEEEHPRREYDRHSGTGRGNEFKRDGAGRGNWGSLPTDEVALETEENGPENEKSVGTKKQPREEDAVDASKENAANEPDEKEPENKEMTLEEYEKILEEKRKALLVLKTEERKVDVKEFESMQQLSNKKSNVDIFIKLGSEKDKRRDADKEEKVKKSVSINEFLKPAEGERYYGPRRGRGRGRDIRGGNGGNAAGDMAAPSIEDPGHFPSLGGK